jgi:hypothetical protein
MSDGILMVFVDLPVLSSAFVCFRLRLLRSVQVVSGAKLVRFSATAARSAV